MIQLYSGDDSDFAGLNQIVITIETDLTLTGYTGCFYFLGVEKALTTAEVAAKRATISFTSQETAGFTLGQNFGKLVLWDADGKKAAVSRVLVEVLSHRECAGTASEEISVIIENQYDYEKSRNKPSINGVTVQGAKTGREYGLNRICEYSDSQTYAIGDQCLHNLAMFECIVAIPSGEAWTDEHWQSIGGSTDPNAVHKADLKAAVTNPSSVKLSPASIKEYLETIYANIQAL